MQVFISVILMAFLINNSISNSVYKALNNTSISDVEIALDKIQKDKSSSLNNAYKGTLLMKKAGLVNGPSKKLKTFKEGHELLELEIKAQPNNVEYRFLRLTIQENAPKILGYNDEIIEDKKLIVSNFKKLKTDLKAHILDYASKSEVINKKELVD